MRRLTTAGAIFQMTHRDWIWTAYDVGGGYHVYRQAAPGSPCDPTSEFVRAYRFRFFAKRRCRIGSH